MINLGSNLTVTSFEQLSQVFHFSEPVFSYVKYRILGTE